MAIHELSLTHDYVPDWGLWEGIRELYQNAIDAHDEGFDMSIVHERGWLFLTNSNADISLKVLLLGHTTKRDKPELRGEKGEGLDLGMLALVRAGYKVQIRTKTHYWEPTLKYSDAWDTVVLTIQTRKLKKKRSNIEVKVQLPREQWDEMRVNFLEEALLEEDKVVRVSDGEVLMDPRFRGKIFAKGIFVQRRNEFRYGYNMKLVKLDRDRRVVDDFDFKWNTAQMLCEAAGRFPKKMGKKVWKLIEDDEPDVGGVSAYNTTKDFRESMAAIFKEKHGDDTIIVNSMEESEKIDHMGIRGIVAPRVMQVVMRGELDTVSNIIEKSSKAATTVFTWSDLVDSEQQHLKRSIGYLDKIADMFYENHGLCDTHGVSYMFAKLKGNYLEKVSVVTFRDDNTQGLLRDEKIHLSRACLVSELQILRVLVHEIAHFETDAGDGTRAHIHFIEDMWSMLFMNKTTLVEVKPAT